MDPDDTLPTLPDPEETQPTFRRLLSLVPEVGSYSFDSFASDELDEDA